MADYRYLVDADIYWDDEDEKFQEIKYFLENCAKDLDILHFEGYVFALVREAYKLVAPLELFGFCPYYIESMKQDYVRPYYIESDAAAYNRRVLVFATAYFLLVGSVSKSDMRSYYKAFIGQQGDIIDKFRAWVKEAEEKHLDFDCFEKEFRLKDIREYGFYRNPWDKITNNFEPEVMVRILDQYKTLKKKKYILDCMEAFCLIRPQFAYMLDAERPGSIAKYREWIGREMEINPHYVKDRYATYEKDYMVVHHVDNDGIIGHIAGHYIPYGFFETMSHAIGHWRYDADDPMEDYSNLSWNCLILRQIVFFWNEFNKTQKLPNSEDGFERIVNEHIDVDVWLSFYALLFLKSDRKEWEDQLMQKMKTVLPQTRDWRDHQLDMHEGNVFDEIEKAFEEEKKELTDADFQANLVEWDHLDEKDWAYATRGFRKDAMLIFIKAGRTHVEQWRLAEALEKSYAKLVESDEMPKIENFNALVDLENIKDEILQGTYLVGAKPIDSEEMYKRLKRKQYEELEKEMEALKAENERLKAENEGGYEGRVTKEWALAIWSLIKDKVDMDRNRKTKAKDWYALINKLSGFGISSLSNANGSGLLNKSETEIKEMNVILKKVGLPEIKNGKTYKL